MNGLDIMPLLRESDRNDLIASPNSFSEDQKTEAAKLTVTCEINSPLISVIIPAYNAEKYILDTLNSVLSQTYKNIEVLVVDDGSTDRTIELIYPILQKDDRVILLQQQNSGVAAARNLAIEKSIGEFVAPIDADDIWYPQKLEKQLQCILQADPSVGLVYAWSADIDEDGRITGRINKHLLEGNVYDALVYGNFLGNASVPLIRRSCLDKVGYYNCQLVKESAQGCEDTDLYLRIAEYYQFRVVPEFLVGYRKVLSSMSNNYKTMERSHCLVLQSVRARKTHIPEIFYKWSNSNFYIYLSSQSRRSGNHKNTLFWMFRAATIDPLHLLNIDFHILFIKSFIKLILHPIASPIWPDQRAWLRFKRQLFYANSKELTLADLQEKANRPQEIPRTLYKKIQHKRGLQVTQDCEYKRF